MRDEMDARMWAEHHQDWSDAVGTAFAGIARSWAVAMDRLNHFQFDAPWREDKPGTYV